VSESEEPDWLAKGGEALRRELLPLVRGVDQIVREARLAKASGGPALPLVQRIALIVDSSLNEWLSTGERPVVHQATAALTVNVTMSATATVTASGGLAMRRMGLAGQGTVQNRRSVIGGHLLIMVILWLLVLVSPAAIMKANLSSGAATMLDAYYGAVAATAVAVTIDYLQKRGTR
jgi:hypothetical protein